MKKKKLSEHQWKLILSIVITIALVSLALMYDGVCETKKNTYDISIGPFNLSENETVIIQEFKFIHEGEGFYSPTFNGPGSMFARICNGDTCEDWEQVQ